MLTDKKIVIIGAGLTGALLSIYLAKRGYQISIYEQRSHDELLSDKYYEKGRVLSLDISKRGFRALSGIGLADKVLENVVPMRSREIHLPDEILSISYGISNDDCINTVSRFKLHNTLIKKSLEQSNISIQFGFKFLNYDNQHKIINFFDVASDEPCQVAADVVLGCDGAYSKVRDYIETATNSHFKKTKLPFDYKVFTIPKEKASKLAFNAMHMWPRENIMLVAQPNYDGSFVSALLLPDAGEKSFSELEQYSQQQFQDFFKLHFSDAFDLIPNLNEEMSANPVGSFYAIKGEHWRENNHVLLLGDAVHAMPPFLGQGVNSCFEDCYLLNKYLDVFDDNWESVIANFERDRKTDAESITRMSVENYPELTDFNWRHYVFQREVEEFIMQHFKPAYISYHNLICFHTVPYRYAEKIRTLQKELIQRVTQQLMMHGSLTEELVRPEFDVYMEKKNNIDELMSINI